MKMYSTSVGSNSFTVTVADVTIKVITPHKVKITERFLPFLSENKPDFVAEFIEVEELTKPTGKCLYEETALAVYKNQNGEFVRCFRDAAKDNKIYAIGHYDFKNKNCRIEYLPYSGQFISESGNSFFHIAFETLLLHQNRLILHSSSVITDKGVILFSGRSGIGKSTQADLWRQYEGAELLNGDRTILCQNNSLWNAYGSPYAGSSRCYVNKSSPVRAIVMLGQAEKCSISRLSGKEAFYKIFQEITVNSWDTECVQKSCDLLTKLVGKVPAYEFGCTPDKAAVTMLKSVLKGDYDD
jgi:hypothetical protein